jgi:hypothetical protein
VAAIAALVIVGGVVIWLSHVVRDETAPQRDSMRESRPDVVSVEKPAAVSTDFVGSQKCRECHHDVWKQYQTHPMSHSMGVVSDAAAPEDYERKTAFTAGQNRYRVERTEQGVRHHEIAADYAGKTIYDQAVDVHYAVGSGTHGRSYIIDRGGILFMSPISWYAGNGHRRWDLSPGYPREGHLRFERRAIDQCLSCHVGLANPKIGAVDRFQTPPFLELSIGCERCHGPGQEHVRLHQTMVAEDIEDPIVNPSRLDPSRRDAVCFQCHLQGQDTVLRYGRTDFDFRPGMHVGDVWTVLLEGPGVADDESTKAVGHVQQMLASRCYMESRGKLGCLSCHDPHSSVPEASAVGHYRLKCLVCHTDRGCSEPTAIRRRTSAEDSCVTCHMPRLDANDVPHSSRTDHRIVRRYDSQKQESSEAVHVGMPQIFDADAVKLSQAEMDRARGLFMSKLAMRQESAKLGAEVERLLTPWSQTAPDDLPVLNALALAAALQQKPERATAFWKAMLAISPENETALNSLALQAIALGRQHDALQFMDEYLAVNPWNVRMHGQRSWLLARLGRDAEAIDAAKQAIELDPSHAEAYHCLAAMYARLGRTEDSRRCEALYRRFAR